MKKLYLGEFAFQLCSLLIMSTLVHTFYVVAVTPRARAILDDQAERMRADPSYIQERSVWVIIKDYEQESEFILCFWALAIMGAKWLHTAKERRALESDLVPLAEGARILPEDAREYARQIEAWRPADKERLLPRTILAALYRFRATRSLQDASATAREVCASQADRLDSELSMIRYIAWAIPSIGFIGTVRGIGDALSQAHRAIQGDVSGVTEALGVAFNSTLIALLLSLVLMFVLHQLQLQQERLVLDTEHYVNARLIHHMQGS
jgi:biopolymer transport protein ExbB/TolQ